MEEQEVGWVVAACQPSRSAARSTGAARSGVTSSLFDTEQLGIVPVVLVDDEFLRVLLRVFTVFDVFLLVLVPDGRYGKRRHRLDVGLERGL